MQKEGQVYFETVETVNISPMLALLISEKMATLQELKTVYTLSDAYTLYEVWATTKENELRYNKYNEEMRKSGI